MTEQREKAAAEPPLDCRVGRDTPRVDALVAKVMADFPAHTAAAEARYYDEVHQHLAPLARELERECVRLREALKKANEQAEHFEREWYLRGDALERAADVARNACYGWNDALMHEGARMAADAVQALLVPNA